jgi:hypothetical protein
MGERVYRTYRNENGGVVRAHVTTEATEGRVNTLNGPVNALAGDVIVPSQNEYYSEIIPGDEFDEGYREVTQDELDEAAEQEGVSGNVSGAGVRRGFDPSKETASEVRKYLSSVNSQEEYERVAEAERNGRNRSTAIPEREWED